MLILSFLGNQTSTDCGNVLFSKFRGYLPLLISKENLILFSYLMIEDILIYFFIMSVCRLPFDIDVHHPSVIRQSLLLKQMSE